MKLADWAKEQGIDYKTAYRWFRAGILPIPAEQFPTGTILVHPQKQSGGAVALYARVSSHDQKADLDRQMARLIEYATEQSLVVTRVVNEVGSGLNGKRSKRLSLLRAADVEAIVVEHRDRLARLGSEHVEAALQACGRRLLVIDPAEMKDDLVQDMVDVLTSLCARLYGRRSAKNRAQRAVEVATEE